MKISISELHRIRYALITNSEQVRAEHTLSDGTVKKAAREEIDANNELVDRIDIQIDQDTAFAELN